MYTRKEATKVKGMQKAGKGGVELPEFATNGQSHAAGTGGEGTHAQRTVGTGNRVCTRRAYARVN